MNSITDSGTTAILMFYYENRLKYLAPIIKSIFDNSYLVKEVILWNNNIEKSQDLKEIAQKAVGPVRVIDSETNVGCIGRYLATEYVTTENVLFHDDDLILNTNAIAELFKANHLISGCIGRTFTDKERPYIAATFERGNCDVVVGRITLTKTVFARTVVNRAEVLGIKDEMFRCDDVVACSFLPKACKYTLGVNYFTNLDEEGTGLSHLSDHYTHRDELCRSLLKRGYFND